MRSLERTNPRRVLSAALTSFLVLPHAIVALTVLYGPHASEDALPGWFSSLPALSIIPVFFAGYIGYRFSIIRSTLASSISHLALSCAGLTLISIAYSMFVHRDFMAAAFQYLMGMPLALIVVFHSREARGATSYQKRTVKAIGFAGLAISFCYAQWSMMMGYAIVTRAEPRPIESGIYNLYNLILTLSLVFLSREVRSRGDIKVHLYPDALVVDGKDVSQAFGQKKLALLRAFALTGSRTLTCQGINDALGKEGSDPGDCRECSGETTKAALCKRYRTTYNLVLDLKKSLELVGIGSVTGSENRRQILDEGWRFAIFENVRISIEAKKRPDSGFPSSGL